MKSWFVAACVFLIAACGGEPSTKPPSAGIDRAAEDFVKLALSIAEHDPSFVDAYHGPQEWADAAKVQPRSLPELAAEAARIKSVLAAVTGADPGRLSMLEKQLVAAETRIAMKRGETFSFNEETKRLYDAVAPQYDLAEFDAALEEIEALLPGEGPPNERVEEFRKSLAIPAERLQVVFEAAIAECRRRTLEHYSLPENERFSLEFVNDKPWSGYNWYRGDYESLIQINTDLPIVIDRAVDLGCHEGYPGHHTWSMYIERELLSRNGWIEYAVYPLFSPMSVIAEGSANYGIELAFPDSEKIEFERDVLFPLAGLDPADAELLAHINELRRRLAHSGNHVAREYLEGRMSRDEAIAMLMKYSLYDQARAAQRVDFIETYRGYVINYNLGRDLVADYIKRVVGDGGEPWTAFQGLLIRPVTASDLLE